MLFRQNLFKLLFISIFRLFLAMKLNVNNHEIKFNENDLQEHYVLIIFFNLLRGSVEFSLPSRQRLTDRFRCHLFLSTSLPLPASLPSKSRAAIAVYASAASRCRVTDFNGLIVLFFS